MAVMMCTSLSIRMDMYSASPKFLSANSSKVHSSCTVHSRRLSGIVIERVARDYSHALGLPSFWWCGWDWRMRVCVVCHCNRSSQLTAF